MLSNECNINVLHMSHKIREEYIYLVMLTLLEGEVIQNISSRYRLPMTESVHTRLGSLQLMEKPHIAHP